MQDKRDFYRDRYSGSLFLIKAGGRTVTDAKARADLFATIQDLISADIRVLLVYGGGKAIDDAFAANNIVPEKKDGLRVTTQETMQIIKSVMTGDIGFRIASTMKETGIQGICLNALPPAWADIALHSKDGLQTGYVGEITDVHPGPLRALLNTVPFVACPCLGVTDKDAININADDVAVALAAGCQFRKLVFLSDVDGVEIDGEVASILTDHDIPALIDSGKVAGGMKVKLESCMHALEHGVRRIHLINGLQPQALAREIYESEGIGTMILREADKERYLKEVGDKTQTLKKA